MEKSVTQEVYDLIRTVKGNIKSVDCEKIVRHYCYYRDMSIGKAKTDILDNKEMFNLWLRNKK